MKWAFALARNAWNSEKTDERHFLLASNGYLRVCVASASVLFGKFWKGWLLRSEPWGQGSVGQSNKPHTVTFRILYL